MRKFGTIGIIGAALAATLALSACGEKKDAATAPTTPAVTAPENKPADAVPQAKTKEELFNYALQMDGFTVGGDEKNLMANPEMVVFFDAQCKHCSDFWNTTTAIKDLKMKWVPVSILGDRSMVLATNILAASNPFEKMSEHEANFDTGGLKEQTVVESFVAKVTRNTDFLVSNIEAGIPTIVFRNSKGEFGVDKGNIPLEQLAKILGRTDVELKTADNSAPVVANTNSEQAPANDAEASGTVVPAIEDAAKKLAEEAKTVTEDVSQKASEETKAVTEDAKKLAEEVKTNVKDAAEAIEKKVSK